MTFATSVLLCVALGVQLRPTDSPLTHDEIREALAKSGVFSNEAIRLIEAAERDGKLAKFGSSKKTRLAAGVAALAAATRKPVGIGTSGIGAPSSVYSADRYADGLASLGRLVITSRPSGATVSVDGYKWETETDAEGFAASGRRSVIVSQGTQTVRVQCEVAQESVMIVTVDFPANIGSCKPQRGSAQTVIPDHSDHRRRRLPYKCNTPGRYWA
jgi:hypothetical protein